MKKRLLIIFSLILVCFILHAQQIVQVRTFAGSGVGGNANGTGAEASFKRPQHMCSDASGNIYVADEGTNSIRKITPAGVVSTFAGSGAWGSNNGTGTAASFSGPSGICIDAIGNLYVSDRFNNLIRKITPLGVVSTFAGTGEWSATDGAGNVATFQYPTGICIDGSGNLYVAETWNRIIRKITPGGYVTTIAGSIGNIGHDDGNGTAATFVQPEGICSDASGNLYVTDGSVIRKITPSKDVTTFVGGGSTRFGDGTGAGAYFNNPYGICIDGAGNLYVADVANNRIRKVTPSRVVTTYAGSDRQSSRDGAGTSAAFDSPRGICIDPSGNLFVSELVSNKIRKITLEAPAPPVVYFDIPGNLCMGSTLNNQPAVTGSDVGLTFLKNTFPITAPKSLCKTDSFVYVVNDNDGIMRYDFNNHLLQVYPLMYSNITEIEVDKNGKMYVVIPDNMNPAITNIVRLDSSGYPDFSWGVSGGTIPGMFSYITDIELGPDGYLYAADSLSVIVKVDTINATTTPLPSASNLQYSIYKPFGIAFDSQGNLFVADKGNKNLLIRNSSDNNYYPALPGTGLDTLNWEVSSVTIDAADNIMITANSPSFKLGFGQRALNVDGSVSASFSDLSFLNLQVQHVSEIVSGAVNSQGVSKFWISDVEADEIKTASIFSYKIQPSLPAGLTFDFNNGKILGTPTAPSPATTYTISVTNSYGTTTSTINFSVDPPGPVSNAPGTSSSKVQNHSDGLNINYFENNNCAEMMSIKDDVGGASLGNTQVNQTVYPTIANFSTGKFVPRVNEINTQNPNAAAHLKFYFTFLDIEHYNQSNGADPDLINDIVGGTMQVSVLQLHTDSTGRKEQIKHGPITANWDNVKQLWVVDFAVTKMSTFYMGQSSVINTFDCSNAGTPENIIACGNYRWRGRLYIESGTYRDTTANIHGCDSVLTLNLTIVNDFEITQNNQTLTCNTAGATYKWANADNNYAVINGATSQTYTATSNGNYAVIATKNSCTDTSATVYVSNLSVATGINDNQETAKLEVYPNPSTGVYNIESMKNCRITVRSTLGEIVLEEQSKGKITTIDLSAYPSGIYILTIQTDSSGKTTRLIKN